jgi:vacuolar-type H+-ATPase subunit H
VPALSEILRRFRSHGVPGAPAVAAVPADHRQAVANELAPVFAALDEVQRRARGLTADAEAYAAAHREEATLRARRILADARSGAGNVQVDAMKASLAHTQRQRVLTLANGRQEAARIERVAAQRVPLLVDDTVRRVLASVAPTGTDLGTGAGKAGPGERAPGEQGPGEQGLGEQGPGDRRS